MENRSVAGAVMPAKPKNESSITIGIHIRVITSTGKKEGSYQKQSTIEQPTTFKSSQNQKLLLFLSPSSNLKARLSCVPVDPLNDALLFHQYQIFIQMGK
mmetsp:Transcript_554/g.996  ORF Transcript_554/g.996 Transcript_554/m.996 type:complete len:100 (-) Transcript_554:76-375(-)